MEQQQQQRQQEPRVQDRCKCNDRSAFEQSMRLHGVVRERERELRREGGEIPSFIRQGSGPLPRPTTIRRPEHISGWVNYPPAYVIWVDGGVARPEDRDDVPQL